MTRCMEKWHLAHKEDQLWAYSVHKHAPRRTERVHKSRANVMLQMFRCLAYSTKSRATRHQVQRVRVRVRTGCIFMPAACLYQQHNLFWCQFFYRSSRCFKSAQQMQAGTTNQSLIRKKMWHSVHQMGFLHSFKKSSFFSFTRWMSTKALTRSLFVCLHTAAVGAWHCLCSTPTFIFYVPAQHRSQVQRARSS